MNRHYNKFLELSIFDQISGAELTSVLNCVGGFVKSYDAESYIILDGGSIECVGIVISGMVHMIKEDIWGGKAILAIMGPSQMFGETYVVSNSSKSNVAFLATECSEILFLPFQRVIQACSRSCTYHRQLIDNMLSLIARKNLILTDKLEIMTKRSLRAKILTYLSQEAQKNNSKYLTIPLGRIEMADYLCVDRSALTRELTKMKNEGILDYSNNTFRLL